MAKRSMVEREKRRIKLSKRMSAKRESLRNIIKSQEASMEDKLAASERLQKMPRDSSASRITNRCAITGRPSIRELIPSILWFPFPPCLAYSSMNSAKSLHCVTMQPASPIAPRFLPG